MRTGPKSKPTELHRLHGTFDVTRHGKRREPKAPGDLKSLEPPPELTDEERAIWDYTVTNAPAAVLRNIDRNLLRMWAITEARIIKARAAQAVLDANPGLPLLVKTKAGEFVSSPYEGIMNRAMKISMRLSELLGFCPVGRAEFSGGKDDDDQGWEFLKRPAANG